MGALGRRTPETWEHVERYPLSALVADQALPVPAYPSERSLGLPWWWKDHDQGQEGSCVGFGCSAMMSITNHEQRRATTGQDITYRYACHWLYEEAQLVDEWTDTPPEEGTSVNAACQILRARGHRRVQRGVIGPESTVSGITAYRWAQTSDEIRAAIWAGLAVSIGVNWYSNFDDPVSFGGELWIGRSGLGFVRGGHCVCLYRFSDRREAFRLMNSWGADYPPVWVPYDVVERLISEQGEAVVITDR